MTQQLADSPAVPPAAAVEADASSQDAKEKSRKHADRRRGIETMFRVTYQNHIALSQLADQKAGREPADPVRLFRNAGQLTTKYPLDRFPGHAAWIDGTWKLHRIEPAKGSGARWELYDLAADAKEARDRSATEPKRLESMQKELTAWLESVVRSLNGEDYPKP